MTNDQAFDMLPYAVDIFEKLEVEKFIKSNKVTVDKGSKDLEKEQGIKLIKFLLKNANKVKEEIFHVVAIAESKSVKEVREADIGMVIKAFKDILQDKALMDFFSQGVQ